MSEKRTHLTSIVVFAVAAFFVGLIIGVNCTPRDSAGPVSTPVPTRAEDPGEKLPATGGNAQKPAASYPEAPEFSLVTLETGETVELADFAGSHLVLFVSTTT